MATGFAPPSLRYLLAVATPRYPRYLLPVLNSFDEVYALVMLLVERHFLRTYGGSFTENFYSMKRARVLRVVDGDTILVRLDGRRERLRYIGIDTPESVAPDRPVECYGPAAAEENRRLVGGRTVTLTADEERRDRFGRLLAYVRVGDLFVNGELVRRGAHGAQPRHGIEGAHRI